MAILALDQFPCSSVVNIDLSFLISRNDLSIVGNKDSSCVCFLVAVVAMDLQHFSVFKVKQSNVVCSKDVERVIELLDFQRSYLRGLLSWFL